MIEVNENELENVFMLRSYVDKILYIQSDTDIYDSNSSSSGSNYSMI
mgnify:CR=1 FL=1